jgi:hypothetical protein
MMQRIPLNGPLGAAVLALLIIAVFVVVELPSLAVSVFSIGGGRDRSTEVLDDLITMHDERSEIYKGRFDGRSLFFKPPPKPVAPPPVATAPQPDEEPPPSTPTPPPPPAKYLGPSLIAINGLEAWFMPDNAGDPLLRIPTGQTRAGVEVIEILLPWSVKVRHKGGEYVLDLFERVPENVFQPASTDRPVPGLVEVAQVPGDGDAGAAAARSAGGDGTADDLQAAQTPEGDDGPAVGEEAGGEDGAEDGGDEGGQVADEDGEAIEDEPAEEGDEPLDDEELDEEPLDGEELDEELDEEPLDDEELDEELDDEPLDEGSNEATGQVHEAGGEQLDDAEAAGGDRGGAGGAAEEPTGAHPENQTPDDR